MNLVSDLLALIVPLQVLDLTYKKNIKYIFEFYQLMPPHLFENTSEAIKQEYYGDGFITEKELPFKKVSTQNG